MEDFKLYVGTYGKYNAGSLNGAWLAPMDYDTREDFLDACYKLHADEDDPELMFQDYDGEDFGMYSEYGFSEDFWNVLKAAEKISDEDAFAAFCSIFQYELQGKDADEIDDLFNEKYYGHFDDYDDFGREMVAIGCVEIPDQLECYFNYEAYGRDCSYDFHEYDGYYFWAC